MRTSPQRLLVCVIFAPPVLCARRKILSGRWLPIYVFASSLLLLSQCCFVFVGSLGQTYLNFNTGRQVARKKDDERIE